MIFGFSNGVLGMVVASIGLFVMLMLCASLSKENTDRALAKEIGDVAGE
jgi:hypothetical protein